MIAREPIFIAYLTSEIDTLGQKFFFGPPSSLQKVDVLSDNGSFLKKMFEEPFGCKRGRKETAPALTIYARRSAAARGPSGAHVPALCASGWNPD